MWGENGRELSQNTREEMCETLTLNFCFHDKDNECPGVLNFIFEILWRNQGNHATKTIYLRVLFGGWTDVPSSDLELPSCELELP